MLKPLSIFIDYSRDEARLIREIAAIVGQPLVRADLDGGLVHRCRAFDTEFSIFREHGLDDDCGILFSTYTYELTLTGFEIGIRTGAFATMYESMTLYLAERLSNELQCRTLVVKNLQREVAEFSP